MKEVHNFFEEKGITRDTGEEVIFANGMPAVNVYSDRTHLYIIPSGNYWLDWGKIVNDTYGDWGTHQHGQVCCLLLQMAKSVMKSKLDNRCLLTKQ